MKKSCVYLGILGILGSPFLLATPEAKASQSGWIQIEKIAYDFQDIVRVELQGVVTESTDPSHKGKLMPFTQSLHFSGGFSKPLQKAFPTIPEVRAWALNTPCSEVHEIMLNPHRESGNRASQKLQSKMSPFSVTLIGVRAETKGAPVSELVFCKKFEATGQNQAPR